ncbi:MAG: uracil-DNA glycosylase [Bacteroidales bacterium]
MREEDYTTIKAKVLKCSFCRLSETRKNAVPGEGDTNAHVMIIGQAPGREEDKYGKMFIGPSGKVLDNLFSDLDLHRQDFYMTNMLKCFLPHSRKPRSDEIDVCSSIYLSKEIELINPEIIISLGYHVTKFFLRDYDLKVPSRDNFSNLFGQLIVANNRKLLPLRHPATVVHQSAKYETLLSNYKKINIVERDCKWFTVCPIKRFYEEGKIPKYWIDRYCKGDWESCRRFQLEEANIYHPDNMLPDGSIVYNL